MYDIERKEKVLDIIRERGSCSVKELASLLSFSESTIRHDLTLLESEMRIKRSHGGAMIRKSGPRDMTADERRNCNIEVKARLCRAASELLHDNMTIFLDSSSTVEQLLPNLANLHGITLFTNNPDIPVKMKDTDAVVYSSGGRYNEESHGYVGEFARMMLAEVNADIMFFSAMGVGEGGEVTVNSGEDDVRKTMIRNSRQTCLLFDSSKYGYVCPFTVCNIKEVDTVITDLPFPGLADHPDLIIA